MVIFYSYVKLPEGNLCNLMSSEGPESSGWRSDQSWKTQLRKMAWCKGLVSVSVHIHTPRDMTSILWLGPLVPNCWISPIVSYSNAVGDCLEQGGQNLFRRLVGFLTLHASRRERWEMLGGKRRFPKFLRRFWWVNWQQNWHLGLECFWIAERYCVHPRIISRTYVQKIRAFDSSKSMVSPNMCPNSTWFWPIGPWPIEPYHGSAVGR